jgi:hypothetical protein
MGGRAQRILKRTDQFCIGMLNCRGRAQNSDSLEQVVVAATVDFLSLLPDDLGPDHILPLVDAVTCARCAAVSRRWRSQARLESLWRAHCQALWTGKAVRLNCESPWVRVAPSMNGKPTCDALPCPVLKGGASAEDGMLLSWFETYSASLESRGRIALTDHDLVCNDWEITFSDAMIGYLPPELLSIILSDEEQLRAKFECTASGRRYTDGVFFRSNEPAEGHTAHWYESLTTNLVHPGQPTHATHSSFSYYAARGCAAP